ncbi:MAG: hypothetical protein K9K67_15030 [Bacteriovoracaceae bacterium]|nr:hypothetical protein [Bacteriovoracaceae bacterium]
MSLKTEHFKSTLREGSVAELSKKIDKLLESTIAVEIDLDSFDVDYGNGSVLESDGMKENFDYYCFNPLLGTLEKMVANSTYKAFLAKNLRTINISNVKETDPQTGFASFSDNALFLRSPVTTSGASVDVIGEVIFEAFNNAG